jgi:1,4-dihydroxy-2-naphthoate octaprenyltransferase
VFFVVRPWPLSGVCFGDLLIGGHTFGPLVFQVAGYGNATAINSSNLIADL